MDQVREDATSVAETWIHLNSTANASMLRRDGKVGCLRSRNETGREGRDAFHSRIPLDAKRGVGEVTFEVATGAEPFIHPRGVNTH